MTKLELQRVLAIATSGESLQTINVYDRVQRKLVERITLNEALERLQPRYGDRQIIAADLADGVTFRVGQIVYRGVHDDN